MSPSGNKSINSNINVLFLDRDGVINKNLPNESYVTAKETFYFLPGVLKVMPILSQKFKYIIVVSNQQCIGKGIITEKELNEIHSFMIYKIEEAGGRIDKVYFAPGLKNPKNKFRKPEIGMAHLAKKDFPDIDFENSIIVGDKPSDVEFGKKAGMQTVYIKNKLYPITTELQPDFIFDNLADFATSL